MNYFKSALAGFGMSFIGTSLCGAKTGARLWFSPSARRNSEFLKLLLKENVESRYFSFDPEDYQYFIHIPKELNQYIEADIKNGSYSITAEFSRFKPYDAWCGDQSWTFPKSFRANNIVCIPTAMLGAAYHDYFGKDVSQKFNDYFKTDVSPYILDGAVFGSLVLFCGIPLIALEEEIDKTFILSMAIIQGFVLGCTAAFGAYFGDEEVSPQNEELDVTPLDPC